MAIFCPEVGLVYVHICHGLLFDSVLKYGLTAPFAIPRNVAVKKRKEAERWIILIVIEEVACELFCKFRRFG